MIIMAQSSKLFTSQPGQVLAKLPARTMENNTTLAYKYWTAYVIAYEWNFSISILKLSFISFADSLESKGQ